MSILKVFCLFSKPALDYASLILLWDQLSQVMVSLLMVATDGGREGVVK